MNNVFVNCSEEDEIYPFTAKEITKVQRLDRHFKTTVLKKSMKRLSPKPHQCSAKIGN